MIFPDLLNFRIIIASKRSSLLSERLQSLVEVQRPWIPRGSTLAPCNQLLLYQSGTDLGIGSSAYKG